MNVIQVKTESELKQLFGDLFHILQEGGNVFRGISEKKELNPSLVRNYWDLKLDGNLNKYESFLLKEYGRYASQYISNHLTPIDWVASAQHYGLPTRLIDWSFDPFCSLFFSVGKNRSPEDDVYRLYICKLEDNMYFEELPTFEFDASVTINYNNDLLNSYIYFVASLLNNDGFLNKSYRDTLRSKFVTEYKEKLAEEMISKDHNLLFCKVYESNPRIIAQKGLFQIPRRFYDYKGENICIVEDIENSADTVYEISKELRSYVLDSLNKINVNTPRLFPDLGSICTYLKYYEIDSSEII